MIWAQMTMIGDLTGRSRAVARMVTLECSLRSVSDRRRVLLCFQASLRGIASKTEFGRANDGYYR